MSGHACPRFSDMPVSKVVSVSEVMNSCPKSCPFISDWKQIGIGEVNDHSEPW